MSGYESHPSYGIIQISRFSSNGATFFDSPFKHQHGITISIHGASKKRDLHQDWTMSDEEMIRISMSETQFATMISSLNQASGTPCTLERYNGKTIEECPQENVRETFSKDIQETLGGLAKVAAELAELTEMKDAKAEDRKKIRSLASQLAQAFRANFAFMQEQFEKQVEKAVVVARTEISAHVAHVVKEAGLQAIGEKQFRLEI